MRSSIKEMHYQFKVRLNKIDSTVNVNYRVPEIDWKLRRAEFQFIKDRISQANQYSRGSFEYNNRVIDDLKNVVITQTINSFTHVDNTYFVNLPDDYYYYVECFGKCVKGNVTKNIRCFVRNNNEEILAFNTSSFEWEELNIIFINKGIMIVTDGTFTVSEITLKYIKIPSLLYNAEDYYGTVSVRGSELISYYNTYGRVPKGLSVSITNVNSNDTYTVNGYKTLNSQNLFGYVDSELPANAMDEIVDIAVKDEIQDLITRTNQTKT